MGYIVVVIFLVFSFPSVLFAQWEKVKNIPPPYDDTYWLEIYFLPDKTNYGWVCGYDGRVLRTTDEGKSWEGVSIRGAYQLEHVHFVDEKIGFTSGIGTDGYGVIYKTTDGGQTWFNITPNRAEDLWGHWFVDKDYGIVVGGGCISPQRFFVTTNGGLSWDYEYEVNWFPNSGLTDVILYSRDGLGFATSSGYIWKTTDGGRSWNLFSRSGNNDWQEDLWISGQTIIVPYSTGCGGDGGSGGIRASKDFGKTWKEFPTGTSMFGAFLHDSLRGWACGWNRAVYYTSNGGESWTLMNCGIEPEVSLDDFWFVNDTLGWVVGKGIYKFTGFRKIISQIQVIPDSVACEGDTIILRAVNDAKFYSWSTNAVTREIKVTKSGTYELISWDSECDSVVPAKINISFAPKPKLVLSLQGKVPICEGDTIPLFASYSDGKIRWSDGSTSDTIFVTKPKRYVAYVTTEFGCIDSSFVEFYIVPRSKIHALTPLNICEGDSVILSISGKEVKWFWENDSNLIAFKNTIAVYKPGKYYAKVITNEGCNFSDTITILVRNESNAFEFQLALNSIINFDSTKIRNLKCLSLLIKNRLGKPVQLDFIFIKVNESFSLLPSEFPMNFEPFETKEITLCYFPQKVGVEHDTMIIFDRCWDQIFFLTGIGVPENYASESSCSVNVYGKTFQFTNESQSYYEFPFPNPSSGLVFIPFSGSENVILKLFNSFGQFIGSPTLIKIIKNDKIFYQIDLRSQPSGTYFIQLFTRTGLLKTFPIYLER